MKAIVLNTWAGRRYYPVELIGETAKKFKVRILAPSVMLPGRRYVQRGDVVLVPKYAICEIADDVVTG